MSPRGGDRGGRRPLKTDGDPRKPFNCRLKSSNLEWVNQTREQTGLSAGELADLAFEILRENPDKLPQNAKGEQ